MIEMLEQAPDREVGDDLTPAGLLASIRQARLAEDAAAARQLELAARWADLHPPESIHSAAVFIVPGSQTEEPIAGDGCPLVAEFCVAELGTALGISTAAAKRLMGHALELRHRLTRLWDRVQSGQVPAWRARAVADATIHATPALTKEAAGWVDAQVTGVVERVGPAQLDRLVAEAIKRHHLADDQVDHDEGLGVDPRRVSIDTDHVHYAGAMAFDGGWPSPTPSTSRRPSPTTPPSRRPWGPRSPSMCGAPTRSVGWRGSRPPWTSPA
jgi:hypothetical protein